MTRSRWLLVTVFFMIGTAFLSAQRGPGLQTSHSGPVTDLVYDNERELLLSAGEDGTVRIWSAPEEKLLGVLRISHRPIQRITVRPGATQVAALIGGSPTGSTVEVWDWESATRLYSLDFEEQVLSLRYSPGGSFLVATRADIDSLAFLEPMTGRPLYYLRKGFGIVSFAVVSRNENNIMTYQPSGVITYWEIRSGRMIKQVRTVPNLSLFALSPSNRFLAATYADRLAVIDLLTGDRVDERQVPEVLALEFSPLGNELTGLVRAEGRNELRQWYFGGRYLLELTPPWRSAVAGQTLALCYGGGGVYTGDREGAIFSLHSDGSVQNVARNVLLWHSDAAMLGARLAVAGRDRIVVLESEFLTGPPAPRPLAPGPVATGPDATGRYGTGPIPTGRRGAGRSGAGLQPVPVVVRTLDNPLSSRLPQPGSPPASGGGVESPGIGLEFLDPQTLLVWSRGAEQPAVGLMDVLSGRFQELDLQLSAPLKQVGVFAQGIVIVDERGQCLILDRATFVPRFRFSSPGMNKLIFAAGDTLVGGRTSLSTFGSPLLQITERTGETVAISDPSMFVYNLVFDPLEANLYTLSVDGGGGPGRTRLKLHSGYGFERSRVLLDYAGEDIAAGIAVDSQGRVYSSLGFERVAVWDGDHLERLEEARHVHRELYVAGDKIVAGNRDGSFTFWDRETRRLLLDLYLFQDSSWGVELPDGSTYVPPEETATRRS